PSIVTVFDVGEALSGPFFAMELVEGQTLQERLAGGSGLPLDDVLAIVWHVAEALDYVHGAGLVHRDIKPANVMVERTGTGAAGAAGAGVRRGAQGAGERPGAPPDVGRQLLRRAARARACPGHFRAAHISGAAGCAVDATIRGSRPGATGPHARRPIPRGLAQ